MNLGAMTLLLISVFAGDLDERIAAVLPSKEEEKWLSVPWRTNLMSARVEAQRMSKPMFWWIMNGHPMGCT